jgi:AmiR/NasT family two-component response regulator
MDRRVLLRRGQDRSLLAEILNLKKALESRHLIGVAQGMLMHRYRISEKQAFEYLSRRSQAANVKVRDLAHCVVAELAAECRRPAYTREDGTSERPTV